MYRTRVVVPVPERLFLIPYSTTVASHLLLSRAPVLGTPFYVVAVADNLHDLSTTWPDSTLSARADASSVVETGTRRALTVVESVNFQR